MAAPTLQDVQAQYRQDLLNLDGDASERLVRAYFSVLTTAQSQLTDLANQAEALRLAGQALTRTLLYRVLRLDTAITQIAAQVGAFGSAVSPVVAYEVQQAVALAQVSSRDLMAAAVGPLPPGMGAPTNFLRFNEGAVKEVVADFGAGSPYLTVYDNYPKATAELLQKTFVQAIVDGENPKAVARQLSKTMDVPLTSARTTARTVIVGAYNAASLAEYRANSNIVKRWRWVCSRSPRTCAMCLAMDGQEFDLDVPFESHLSCRCSASPVTASWEELGIDAPDTRPTYSTATEWLAKQTAEVQRQILGKGKYELYSRGDLQLQQLVGTGHNAKWGGYRYEKPLKALAAHE